MLILQNWNCWLNKDNKENKVIIMTKKISCIQMASGINLQGNLYEAERLIIQAVEAEADMVVLPEDFAFMGSAATDKLEHSEKVGDGPIQSFISNLADKHNVWIVAGSIPMKCDDPKRCRTAVLVYNDEGKQVARYDKMHMFDVTVPENGEKYHESDVVEPGNDICVFDSPLGKMGISVCYDLRFPELYRNMLDQGMEILVVPSAFTAFTGKAHWEPLVLARAIENQCFVAAANQGGYHANGRETHGHSMIVGPWGNVLDTLASGSGVITAEVDLDRLKAIRNNFPAVNHRISHCTL